MVFGMGLGETLLVLGFWVAVLGAFALAWRFVVRPLIGSARDDAELAELRLRVAALEDQVARLGQFPPGAASSATFARPDLSDRLGG